MPATRALRHPDGTVDVDALREEAGEELYAAIVRGVLTVCAAMEMPPAEPVQRTQRRTQTHEQKQEREHTS